MSSPLATVAYLNSVFSNQAYATVSGSGFDLKISSEIAPPVGELALPTLLGGTGSSGAAQFALHFQNSQLLSDPSQLPTDLTNTDADIGRFFLLTQFDDDDNPIFTGAYIWFGSEWRKLRFGNQGPPGPYPVIAPTVTLIGADENSVVNVTGTGSAASPYLLAMELSVPEGPDGPACPLAQFADVSYANQPTIGDVLSPNGSTVTVATHTVPVWAPTSTGDSIPAPYTVPQSSFNSYIGLDFSSTVTVGSFAVPPNSFAWKPLVWGQIAVVGLELSATPLRIGVEVLLGDPVSGTLVARGLGNSIGGVVSLTPHTSSPGSPTTAMTPSNSVALVSANHTGTAGTLYVNLINDGLVQIADFNADNSQLFVMACPSSTEGSVFVVAGLSTKVTLAAKTISHGS